MVMHKIDRREGVQKSYTRADPILHILHIFIVWICVGCNDIILHILKLVFISDLCRVQRLDLLKQDV